MSESSLEKRPLKEDKVWTLPFIMVFINSVVLNSSTWAIVPLMSSYCVEIGAGLKTAYVVASLMSLTAMFLRPVSGFVVDRMNRKKLILITTSANVVLAILHIFARDIRLLAVCRVLQGIAFSFQGVAMMAFSTSFLPLSRIGEGMGWMALANVISQSIGPAVGLYLKDNFGFYACFIFCAVVCSISLLIINFIPYKEEKREVRRGRLTLDSIISLYVLPYAMICGLFSNCNGLDNTFINLLGEERGITGISVFFTAYSVVMFLARPVSGKLLDRFGLDYIIYPALFSTAFSAVLTGSARSMAVMILAGIIKGIGQSSGSPGIQATCLKKMGKEKAGIVSSTCYIGQDIGNSIAPMIGGVVADRWGYQTMYWGYAVILFVGGGLIYRIKSQYDKRHEAQQ